MDLITYVHGMHYIGDKLGLLEHFYSLLSPSGSIACNLDLDNVLVDNQPVKTWRELTGRIVAPPARSSYRKHILTIEKIGETPLSFGLKYCGGAISALPNYRGITVIDSAYARR